MLYKCFLFKFDDEGVKHSANTALFYDGASLDDVYQSLLSYSCKGWQYADIYGLDGQRWRYCGIFWIEGAFVVECYDLKGGQ